MLKRKKDFLGNVAVIFLAIISGAMLLAGWRIYKSPYPYEVASYRFADKIFNLGLQCDLSGPNISSKEKFIGSNYTCQKYQEEINRLLELARQPEKAYFAEGIIYSAEELASEIGLGIEDFGMDSYEKTQLLLSNYRKRIEFWQESLNHPEYADSYAAARAAVNELAAKIKEVRK